MAAKRKVEELEGDPLTLFRKMSEKEKLDMVKDLIYSKKAKEHNESEESAPARAAKMDARPYSSRPISRILVPRLRPCSGRLKGKAMIYLLTGSVRIKAWAETDSGRFTKCYVYTVLSRVYKFYKS